jgi:hypothetical protein
MGLPVPAWARWPAAGAHFGPAQTSQLMQGIYLRHYPGSNTYLGTLGGRLYGLGGAFGASVIDLGPLADWVAQAVGAGY